MSQEDLIYRWMKAAGCRRIRRTGVNNTISSCPFHEDRKPSFSMNTLTGAFVCYSGNCGMTGNIINFLMGALGWSYDKAKSAMTEMDIPSMDDPNAFALPEYAKRNVKEVEVPDVLITEGSLGMYDFCPRYMVDRGYSKKFLKKWEIGYDYGSSRVTFPVRDEAGKLVGITKRSTFDAQFPKYLHIGFRKSRHLYGAQHVTPSDHVVVVEGNVDVLAWEMMRLQGITDLRCVATMGSQVSNHQVKLLSQYKSVYLAFDNDQDGIAATEFVGEGLIKRMKPGSVRVLRKFPRLCKDVGDVYERPDITEAKMRRFVSTIESYDSIRIEI